MIYHLYQNILETETFPLPLQVNQTYVHGLHPLEEEMKYRPCAVQHHTYGVDPTMKTLSMQDDYVNILKYKDYPFYGLMFHVERPFLNNLLCYWKVYSNMSAMAA